MMQKVTKTNKEEMSFDIKDVVNLLQAAVHECVQDFSIRIQTCIMIKFRFVPHAKQLFRPKKYLFENIILTEL